MTAAGQDGERLVTEEMARKALAAWAAYRRTHRHATYLQLMRAALAAVAPDLDRAGYDRARRECADELRAAIDATSYYHGEPDWSVDGRAVSALAARWSSSGCAPAGEEEQ